MARKPTENKATVADAVSNGLSDISELKEEMSNWADGMEEGNLANSQKCQDVRECADTLENVPEDIDVPESISGTEITWIDAHKGTGLARWRRRDNAVGALRAAHSAAEDRISEIDMRLEEIESDSDEASTLEDEKSELDEFINAIDDAASEAESAEFPGMYG